MHFGCSRKSVMILAVNTFQSQTTTIVNDIEEISFTRTYKIHSTGVNFPNSLNKYLRDYCMSDSFLRSVVY